MINYGKEKTNASRLNQAGYPNTIGYFSVGK